MLASNKKRIAAATLSILLHLFLLAPFVRPTEESKPPPIVKPPSGSTKELDVTLLGSVDKNATKACPGRTYVGVGLKRMFDMVISVAPNGPADRAGVMVGDNVLNFEVLAPDSYPVGYEVTLLIRREGRTKRFKMKTDKICATE